MAKYDFKSAKRYIQMHSDTIASASMGMNEDWFWTAETIFDDGKFLVDLDEDGLKIGGIAGSDWATPTLDVEFKDGSSVRKSCLTGDVGGQAPAWFALGCLSGPAQMVRDGKSLELDS